MDSALLIQRYEADLARRQLRGDRIGAAMTFYALGQAYAGQGRWAEAIRSQQAGLALCQDLGDRQGQGQALHSLGVAHANLGQWAAATGAFEASLRIWRQLGNREDACLSLANLGKVYAHQDQPEQALTCWREALVQLPPQTLEHQQLTVWIASLSP